MWTIILNPTTKLNHGGGGRERERERERETLRKSLFKQNGGFLYLLFTLSIN